jgi:hypothetical protein
MGLAEFAALAKAFVPPPDRPARAALTGLIERYPDRSGTGENEHGWSATDRADPH